MIRDPMPTANPKPTVILVHGFGSKQLWMKLIGLRLRRTGYDTRSWGYSSLYGGIQRHANRLSAYLRDVVARETGPFHIVAHSMGSIIVRRALASEVPHDLGRVILLAPPNHGVPIARIASPFFSWICPAIGELSDSPGSTVNQILPAPNVQFGIIEAKYDILVPRQSTHLDGQADHLSLIATHNSLLFQKRVASAIDSFIRTGQLG